jgi:hypothetical protein
VSGKSIKVDIIFLPLNWNLVIVQAANIPNIVFMTTAINVASIVRSTAFSAYGSVTAFIYAPTPSRNAVTITYIKGSIRNIIKNKEHMVIISHFTMPLSFLI